MASSQKQLDMGGISPTFNTLYLGATKAGAMNGTELLATAAEINSVADLSTRLIAGGATLTLTVADHAGKTVLFDTAAGTVLTLPASAGTGAIFRLVVSVTATSNSHKVSCAAAGENMYGSILNTDTDTSDATIAWAAEVGDTFDTITLNRTTTGLAAIGDLIILQDIGTNKWAVHGQIRSSGTVATPFSSAV